MFSCSLNDLCRGGEGTASVFRQVFINPSNGSTAEASLFLSNGSQGRVDYQHKATKAENRKSKQKQKPKSKPKAT